MKKFYAFLAAALMSVSVFAAKDVVPTDAVLAEYYEPGQVCVCIYVPNDLKCYDIVFVGTYNDWNASASACQKFEPVENFDGWYVVAVDDDGMYEDAATGELKPYESLQGKPVQLDANGDFSWDYQIGAATYVRGGAQIVEGGVAGEIDIKQYGTDAPNVYTVEGWKKDPCSAVYNSYTVAVINDGCGGFAVPFIVGSFNNWQFQQMQVDVEKTTELGAGYYKLDFRAASGAEYQIVSGLMDGTGAIVEQPAWADIAYIQENIDGVWSRINGGVNFALGEEALIVYDLREENLRWTRCDDSPIETVEVSVKLPAENFPEEGVEIIGTFDDWAGTAMAIDGDVYKATVEAKASQFFKFRSAGKWPGEQGGTEIEVYRADDEWTPIQDNEFVFGQLWEGEEGARTLYLDLSNSETYRWQAREQGIENVVLTEKAQKVVVDGVLYIIRDNKMFNVQGTQVR